MEDDRIFRVVFTSDPRLHRIILGVIRTLVIQKRFIGQLIASGQSKFPGSQGERDLTCWLHFHSRRSVGLNGEFFLAAIDKKLKRGGFKIADWDFDTGELEYRDLNN